MAKNLFKTAEIKLALVTGICIIGIAILVKRVFHAEPDLFVTNGPVYVYLLYIFTKGKSKEDKSLYWGIAIIIVTIAIVLTYAL